MVLATVPTVTLLLFALGAVTAGTSAARRLRAWAETRLLRRAPVAIPTTSDGPAPNEPPPTGPSDDDPETDLLLALSIAAAAAPFFLPATPIFGGTKHWMPAYPGVALFAGLGFHRVCAALRREWPARWRERLRPLGEVALALAVVVAPLAETAHSFPFGLSAYVPVVGGTAGGADLGLNRQFWGFTSQNAAEEYLNSRAPRGATVFLHDTTWDAWARMQQEGRVRSDLRGVGSPGEASVALVEHELHMNEVDDSVWIALGTDAPSYVVVHDGVPIVSVYTR
jgi:hypothetical protein